MNCVPFLAFLLLKKARLCIAYLKRIANFVRMRGFNHKKATQALNYLATKEGGSLNKMKAIKLVWLADRLHLRKYGRLITHDSYYAMQHGPVPSSTKDILEDNDNLLEEGTLEYSNGFISAKERYTFVSTNPPDLKVFSKTDIESLNNVYDEYGKFSKYELRDISHFFPEWKVHEESLKNNPSSYLMDYSNFFKAADKDFPLFEQDEEDLELVQNVYYRIDNHPKNAVTI